MVTEGQVRVLRRKLMEGKRQEAAAAGAGMSVRSARQWQAGPYPSQARTPHLWRTRPDPFGEGRAIRHEPATPKPLMNLNDAGDPLGHANAHRNSVVQTHRASLRGNGAASAVRRATFF